MLFVKISYNGHQQLRFTRTNMGLGGPEEDHQLHHCCLTGRVGEREEEEEGSDEFSLSSILYIDNLHNVLTLSKVNETITTNIKM